jgi:hypothetical protein
MFLALGPGKYDDVVTDVREKLEAIGCILLVFEGKQGTGFSVQAPLELQLKLPQMLRSMADMIEGDLKG